MPLTLFEPIDKSLPTFVLPDYDNIGSFYPFSRLPEPFGYYEKLKTLIISIILLPFRIFSLITTLIFATILAQIAIINYPSNTLKDLTKPWSLWRGIMFRMIRFGAQLHLFSLGTIKSWTYYSYKDMQQKFGYKLPSDYKLKYDKMQINNGKTTNNNGKINGYHIKPPTLQKQSSSSWNIFARNKPKKIERKLPYETNVTDVRNLKQDQIVCKADLNWLSAHIHQLFTFTSVSCVRFKESPNDEFRKILGQHNVAEWSGRLSWNPKPKSMRNMNMNNGNNYNNNNNNSPRDEIKYNFKQPKQPGIDWNLWQLARIDSRSRHFQSCLYNNNIGLAQRNGGWLISTRELQPPYRIKGRFFTADKHGILSIYIRCSSIEYPTNNELPLFSIGIHIGNEKLKIVTNRLQNKQITQQCGIGACIDNGYDFQIIDRGVMYPIVCQVERTGKDGKGDNFPRGKNIQIPYPRDSSQWMYHVIFVNSSNEWIIIDRLVVDEKQN
eukprot:484815_1